MSPTGALSLVSLSLIARKLADVDPGWSIEIGPPENDGWIAGENLKNPDSGPFRNLLSRLGETLGTVDRRTIAASFAMRFGWSAGMVIAAYVNHECIPDIRLENISLRFGGKHTMFERLALHCEEGTAVLRSAPDTDPSMVRVSSQEELLALLRGRLIEQAAPVVEALRLWSHFPPRATWGMISSSWGAQCSNVFARIGDQCSGAKLAKRLLCGTDLAAKTQPTFYPVTCGAFTRMYYRSSSCCRYYLLPNKQYCASCPLLKDDVRVERNVKWMRQSLELD
jgi:hypothetical protein